MASKKAGARKSTKAAAKFTIHSSDLIPASAEKTLLPKGMVKVSADNNILINVEKLAKSLIRDQRARMVSSDGCISNPGGPSC